MYTYTRRAQGQAGLAMPVTYEYVYAVMDVLPCVEGNGARL